MTNLYIRLPAGGASTGRKLVASFIALVSLTSIVLAATTGWLTPQHPASTEEKARIALLALAVVTGFVSVLILMRLPRERYQPSPPNQPDIEWLARLQEEISKPTFNHDPRALITFIALITNQSDYRSRVVETIDLDGRSINRHVSVEFVLPSNVAESKSLYLPVLQPVMGDLVDNFRLTDSSDGLITNLSYLETVELAAAGLRTLLLYATGKPYPTWKSTRTAELVLLEPIARRGRSTVESIDSNIKKGMELLEGNPTAQAKEFIGAYLRSLSTGYPIVAAVPQDLIVSNRVLLRYERTVIPPSRSVRFQGKLRLGLGVRPSQITIPVDLAMTAGSYHLRINGPTEKYVVEQILRCVKCRRRLARGTVLEHGVECKAATGGDGSAPPEDSHFHLRGRFGQSFTHLYMRGYAGLAHKSRRYELLVRFNETPPGSRASATVTALAAVTFIWLIGYLSSNGEIIDNSDLPAILLALPAIAASWFGLSSNGGALVGSSLHARLSLIITGVLSIGSVVVYLLQSGAMKPDSKVIKHEYHLTLAGVTNTPWVILLALAFLGLVYISWHMLARVRNYMSLIERYDPLTADYTIV
jgi:hypothetical protein